MKAIMLSVRPKYCALIANRLKTVEVRKTRPRIRPPFKVYIYCTKDTKLHLWRGKKYFYADNHSHTDPVILANTSDIDCNGKVIGEFICNRIDRTFLSNFWHISDLSTYDKPKELSEFGLSRAPQSWRYVD